MACWKSEFHYIDAVRMQHLTSPAVVQPGGLVIRLTYGMRVCATDDHAVE